MKYYHVDRIENKFNETINQLMLKGKINTLRDEVLVIANEALDNHQEVIKKLNSEHATEMEKVKKEADRYTSSISKDFKKYKKNLEEDIEKLKKDVTTKANKQRKDAAARGNRFKKQYDDLLDAIDGILPGAKYLIENRAIPEKEKQRRLKKLDTQIAAQEQEVKNHVGYYNQKYKANDLLAGYGKAQKILEVLRRRQTKLNARVTYDDTVEVVEGEKSTN